MRVRTALATLPLESVAPYVTWIGASVTLRVKFERGRPRIVTPSFLPSESKA